MADEDMLGALMKTIVGVFMTLMLIFGCLGHILSFHIIETIISGVFLKFSYGFTYKNVKNMKVLSETPEN